MTSATRRAFLKQATAAAAGALLTPVYARSDLAGEQARYWDKLPGKQVQCRLCPWRCTVKPGQRGRCQVRRNIDGTYYSLVYGRIAAIHRDPIEKKPFFHFLPGSSAFSLATAGCNFDCSFCQNWTLARKRPDDIPSTAYTPADIVASARKTGDASIAYTYNEPTIYNEFITDTTRLAKPAGLRTVLISNGFINREPLRELTGLIDAYKVDLKSFSEEYYLNVVKGRLAPVLETLETLRSDNIWTEIVYLTVPTLNDDTAQVKKMVTWIRTTLGPDVPVHFTRFHPNYRLTNLPSTPVETLERLRATALEGGLHYAYIGNVPGHEGENTYCHSCGKRLITRIGFVIYENRLESGACGYCGTPIPGIWT
ncbi:AmmeMemoRadiSam system radical SAM enzyme [bacterium]|nr:AmmeMemoRadiSam system radical SAM enzyme [bacterium]